MAGEVGMEIKGREGEALAIAGWVEKLSGKLPPAVRPFAGVSAA
jgi:hypothetical protein